MALLAGRGLDRRIDSQRFWGGFAIAIILGALAWGWSIYWTTGSDFRTSLMSKSIVTRFAAAGVVWFLAVVTIIAWRQKWLGAWAPLTVAAVELAVLVFVGPVVWVWNDKPMEDGPVLKKLAQIEGVGLVGGRLQDLPVSAGNTTAFPYLGITAPPPNYMLESVGTPPPGNDPVEKRWARRFGVTHGVWGVRDSVFGTRVLERIDDPLLDRLMATLPPSRRGGLGPWTLVQVLGAFPGAWTAREVREAKLKMKVAFLRLSENEARDEAWFEPGEGPPGFSEISTGAAEVKSWDGQTAIVEHGGGCILIIRRTYYPGWTYRLDDAPPEPVLRVNCGMQAVPLYGSGIRRVVFEYRPTGLARAAAVSLAAIVAALLVLIAVGLVAGKRSGWLSALV